MLNVEQFSNGSFSFDKAEGNFPAFQSLYSSLYFHVLDNDTAVFKQAIDSTVGPRFGDFVTSFY